MRNTGQQNGLRGGRDAKRVEARGIGEQGQIALVGIQGVRLRVRREHHRMRQIGRAQGGMRARLEHEVSEPVVDQVDRGVAVPQDAVV